jgi:hypothetical protein
MDRYLELSPEKRSLVDALVNGLADKPFQKTTLTLTHRLLPGSQIQTVHTFRTTAAE